MSQSIVQHRDVSPSPVNASVVQFVEPSAQRRVSHPGPGFQGGVGVYGGQGYGLTDGLRNISGPLREGGLPKVRCRTPVV